MKSLMDCCRLPWRGSIFRLSSDMVVAIIVQPFLVLAMSLFSYDSIFLVSTLLFVTLFTFMCFTRRYLRSHIFYYWIASSVTYVIIVFENIVVPLSEIELLENCVLMLFAGLALLCLYLSKTVSERQSRGGDSFNGGIATETCPFCRARTSPRSHHCMICQMCVSKYDYHCFWLNCCIGENNQPFFVFGALFGMLALGYASLLILTTICMPEFMFGILLPKDCSDVSATLSMFTCFVSGIYCMELALLLLLQLIHQVWLISRGFSAAEWREQYGYSICKRSPHSKGFVDNWLQFFRILRKVGT